MEVDKSFVSNSVIFNPQIVFFNTNESSCGILLDVGKKKMACAKVEISRQLA